MLETKHTSVFILTHPITAVLIFLNSSTRSEKAIISVGQTKVKSKG